LCWIKVEVQDYVGNVGIDSSDSPFSIKQQVYFTSPDTVHAGPGESFGYKVTVDVPMGQAAVISCAHKPNWVIFFVDSLWGTMPGGGTTDSVVMVVEAGGFSDTLVMRFDATPGVVEELGGFISGKPGLRVLGSGGKRFEVEIPGSGGYRFGVYDVNGERVWGYADRGARAGRYRVGWPRAIGMRNGVYYAMLETGKQRLMREFVIIR
jgi:hypothetical protein